MTAEMSKIVGEALIDAYRGYARRVHDLTEKLSEEELWKKPFAHGNSIGHLLLHISGNLNYYIGARIANTGYVRDRDREFTEESPPSKESVLKRLDQAVDMVTTTIDQQTAETWGLEYEATGSNEKDRFSIVLKCVAHFAHHIGQIIYLQRELSS